MVQDALRSGFVGLIDVDALDGAAEGGCRVAGVFGLASDGVVEDENSRRAGATQYSVSESQELYLHAKLGDETLDGIKARSQ